MTNEELRLLSELLDSKLDPIKQDISCLRADVFELRQDMAQAKQDISELKQDMAQAKQDISELKQGIAQLTSRVSVLERDMAEVKTAVFEMKVCMENHILPCIQLLAENYLPDAKRYETAVVDMEIVKADVEILKMTVKKHSHMIQELIR